MLCKSVYVDEGTKGKKETQNGHDKHKKVYCNRLYKEKKTYPSTSISLICISDEK